MKTIYTLRLGGPGSIVSRVAYVVEKAIKEAGYSVVVSNDHAWQGEKCEESLKRSPPTAEDEVQITVDHWPWGG